MDKRRTFQLIKKNFLFWVSRKVNFPLIPPDTLQVNFSFRCNLRCKMCNMYNQLQLLESQGKRVEIDSGTLKKIINEAAELRIKDIILIGGEPFLRNDLFNLTRYAKNLGLRVTVITNGVLLDKNTVEECFKSELNCLAVSIDAASQDTLNKIRGENILNSIIENIMRLSFLKDKQNSRIPEVTAICTIMNGNLEELLDVVHLCKNIKIDNIAFQPVVINNADQSEREFSSPVFVTPSRITILDESIDKLIDYKNKNPNFILNGVNHLKLIKKYFRKELRPRDVWPCYAGYNRLQITQDYAIYFCIPPNKVCRPSFGDVSKDNIKYLWYSKEARIRRKLMRKCDVPCLQCCSYRYEFVELQEIFQKHCLFIKK